jgi:hypothetical protein
MLVNLAKVFKTEPLPKVTVKPGMQTHASGFKSYNQTD